MTEEFPYRLYYAEYPFPGDHIPSLETLDVFCKEQDLVVLRFVRPPILGMKTEEDLTIIKMKFGGDYQYEP